MILKTADTVVELYGPRPACALTALDFNGFGGTTMEVDYDWTTAASGQGALLRDTATAFTGPSASGLAYFRRADWLGSSRMSSAVGEGLISATAHAPYGENYAGAGATDLSFTGEKQDISGGQVGFLMREYNPVQGRWWTPDPAGLAAVDPNSPQTWNRYAYLGGNPLNSVDPLGLCHVALQGDKYVAVDDQPGDCAQNSTVTVKGTPAPYDQNVGLEGDDSLSYLEWLDAAEQFDMLHPPKVSDPDSGSKPNPPFLPKAPPQQPGTVTASFNPSRSYANFLACEYGHVMGNSDQVGITLAVNGLPLVALATGNLPRAGKALTVMAIYDIGGAWVVNRNCSSAVYGKP